MPLVTLTLLKGQKAEKKTQILNAVHESIILAGVPEKDRFQRVIELNAENFIYDKEYPNLETSRTDQFVLIEILFSVGRSVKIKRRILTALMEKFISIGVSSNDTMVVFQETAWENWAFANGEIIHA